MSDMMNSIEIHEQYVELLPSRTTMELGAFIKALAGALGPIIDGLKQGVTSLATALGKAT
jgi:hypothetical protein